MRSTRVLVGFLMLILFTPVTSFAQIGDIVIWVPFKSGVTKKDAQIARNSQYVSVKLQAVYAYYKSGFFKNIKQLLIKSDVSLEQGGRRIEGTMLNASRPLASDTGEFIGINDHIAILTPSSPTSIAIRVGFRGVGEDRFKKIFDVLSGSALKTPLNLSEATIGKVTGISSIVQGFLATPYTSDKPKQILDISQSFVLYSADAEQPDALREGYLIVVSSREKRGGGLVKILTLQPSDIRVSALGQQLEYKDAGTWKQLIDNSYLVFSITRTTLRGEDESPWLTKYRAAEDAARKALSGTPVDKAKEEALAIWREGNVLISADGNYLESERKSIRSSHFAEINSILNNASPVAVNITGTDIPSNFSEVAALYKSELAATAASIVVTVRDARARPVVGADVVMRWANNPWKTVSFASNADGEIRAPGVRAGEYWIEVTQPGFTTASTQITVEAKETKKVEVRLKNP